MIAISADTIWTLGLAQAAVATLATILTLGIAFLYRPGWATLLWSGAFTLSMVATFGVISAEINGVETIRRIFLGALMGATALLWSGFRAYWNQRFYLWAGAAVMIFSATLLATVPDDWFIAAYRLIFLVAAVFAGMFAVDWFRFADRRNYLLLPFLVLSIAFFLAGVASAASGLLQAPHGGGTLSLIRPLSSAGMLIYVLCAVTAVLGSTVVRATITRFVPTARRSDSSTPRVVELLSSAQRANEPWSMLYLRLDDMIQIREATGSTVLASVSDRMLNELRDIFPPEADIRSPEVGSAFVLVGRTDAVVRELLRETLDRVAALDISGRLPIRPSVSAGWAPTSTVGYDAGALTYLSREAAALADQNGGDRWERVSAAVVERLLNPLSLR